MLTSKLANYARIIFVSFVSVSVIGLVIASSNSIYAQEVVWSDPINLFETPGRASEAEIIADSSGVVHAFWAYAAPGNEDSGSSQAIYYARQEDGIWSEPVDILVSPGGRVARMQNVVVDGDGYLHIVWSGGNALFYSRAYALEAGSAAGWSQPFALISGVSALEPAIAVGVENELFVLWTQAGAGLIFARSEDGGGSWSAPQAIFPASRENELARWGRIAVDGRGRLHVVLTYTVNDPAAVYGRSDANLLYYLRSDDNGDTWTEPFLVTPEPDFGEINVATFGEDVVHLVWNGRAGRHGRYHRWSSDSGQTWSEIIEILAPAPQNPIGTGGLTGFPALITDSEGVLHMVSTTAGDNYYFRWLAGVWSSPILISQGIAGGGVTKTANSLEQPSITINGGNQLHVVFHDGFERIWYVTTEISASPTAPMPLPTIEMQLDTAESATDIILTPTQTSPEGQIFLDNSSPPSATNSLSALLTSILPAFLLIISVMTLYHIKRKK